MSLKFKTQKVNSTNVAKSFPARAQEIVDNAKLALYDLTVVPEFDNDGRVVGYVPSTQIVKSGVVRKYNIAGQEIEIKGTIYKLGTGGNKDTYFYPDMPTLKDDIETALSLSDLFADMMYWVLRPRTISEVANRNCSDPDLAGFIGQGYLDNLIQDDDYKFSRIQLLQAIAGEKSVYVELLNMLNGGSSDATIVPESSNGEGMAKTNGIVRSTANFKQQKQFNRNLVSLGAKRTEASTPRFGSALGGASLEAGKSALNNGGGLKLKK